MNKVCQDQVLITKFHVNKKKIFIFAVFDDHGKLGERISLFLKNNFSQYLKKELLKLNPKYFYIQKALKNTINSLHKRIEMITKFSKNEQER